MENEGLKAVTTPSLKPLKTAGANARAEMADRAVAVILSSYPPDLAKDAMEYAKQLMRHIEQYTVEEINLIADPRTGIATRCKFPPTIADVVEFVRESGRAPFEMPRTTSYGPNFTQERLAREAEGLNDEPEWPRPPLENWKRHFPEFVDKQPEWIKDANEENIGKIDPNVPWRTKEAFGPPSDELRESMQRHMAEIKTAKVEIGQD